MIHRAHKITAALILLAALFILPPNPTAVFGFNPVLGLVFLVPAVGLLVQIIRRAA